MVFAGYNDSAMDEFVASNPGLFRRISSVFVFDAYQTIELAQILLLKIEESGFKLVATPETRLQLVCALIEQHTTWLQREKMNGGICDHILRNAKRHLDARLTIDDGLEEMMTYSIQDLIKACKDIPTPTPPAGAADNTSSAAMHSAAETGAAAVETIHCTVQVVGEGGPPSPLPSPREAPREGAAFDLDFYRDASKAEG